MASAAFDKLAPGYDAQWTNSPAGRSQRNAVWRHIDKLYSPGQTILDLGCGTGEDALHLMQAGIHVEAFDASAEMVAIARSRGISAARLPLQDLDRLEGTFDGALSNFGALNCVASIAELRLPLARLIRPGGKLAVCVMGRFCLWETLHYLRRGELRKATRRWGGVARSASLGLHVFYPTASRIKRALAPCFVPYADAGIGFCIPPSYVNGLSQCGFARLSALDRKLSPLPAFRGMSDHRLLIFVRAGI